MMNLSKNHRLLQLTFGICTRSYLRRIHHQIRNVLVYFGDPVKIPLLRLQNNLNSSVGHCEILSRYSSTNLQDICSDSTGGVATGGAENGKQVTSEGEDEKSTHIDFFKDFLVEKNFCLSFSDWQELEEQILMKGYKPLSWEAIVMGLLVGNKKYNVGTNFLDYIYKQNRKPSYITLVLFISLCGTDYNAEENMEAIILNTYREVQHSLCLSGLDENVHDSFMCKHLIKGFSKTSQWKECFRFLEMSAITDRPSTPFYSPIVAAAFRNQDVASGFSLLNTMGAKNVKPSTEAIHELLLQCRQKHQPLVRFEDYSSLCNQYGWIPSSEVSALIKEYFIDSKDGQYTVKETRMSPRGSCLSCQHTVRRGGISLEEFSVLQKEYMDKVMIGENIFYKSNPQEFERFREFLASYAPFDVVIDGLNVAYTAGKISKLTQLLKVVEYFALDKKKKVCVIGRKHMHGWNKRQMTQLQTISSCFLADNLSKDDQFILYSTLKSGPNAVFVSIDEMRDSSYLLGEDNARIFRRWQASRQMSVNYVTVQGQVILHIPFKHETSLQSDPGGWHIPYIPEDEARQKRRSYQYPNAWLCVRIRNK